jgi:hypothetical protein
MKKAVFTAILVAMGVSAQAATVQMSCDQAQAQVAMSGYTYIDNELVVANPYFCADRGQTALREVVTSTDRMDCFVGYVCVGSNQQ